MKLDEYIKAAGSTAAKLDAEYAGRMGLVQFQIGDRVLYVNGEDAIHGILGMAGEFQELQRVANSDYDSDEEYREELLKECGDAWWYAVLLLKACDRDIRMDVDVIQAILMKAHNNACAQDHLHLFQVDELIEPLKKWIFYGKPIDLTVMRVAIQKMFAQAVMLDPLANVTESDDSLSVEIANGFNLDMWLSGVWMRNIYKLKRRFQEKFDEALAQTHDSN